MISKFALTVPIFFAMSMAADITSKEITQDGDRNVSEQKITQPKKKGGKKLDVKFH